MDEIAFAQMIDRMCELCPKCKDYQEVRLIFCEEFLRTVKTMKGMDLEPHLAEMRCIPDEECFKITFKIPLVPHNESMSLQ